MNKHDCVPVRLYFKNPVTGDRFHQRAVIVEHFMGVRSILEKEMATHSSILAWRISWREEPGGLLSMESHRVRHDWSNLSYMHALEKEIATHSSIHAWRIPPCFPRGPQESCPTPQFKSISSSELNLFYCPMLTSVHDYWKNHSFDYTDLCRQSQVSAF